jgi:hypothetical protein
LAIQRLGNLQPMRYDCLTRFGQFISQGIAICPGLRELLSNLSSTPVDGVRCTVMLCPVNCITRFPLVPTTSDARRSVRRDPLLPNKPREVLANRATFPYRCAVVVPLHSPLSRPCERADAADRYAITSHTGAESRTSPAQTSSRRPELRHERLNSRRPDDSAMCIGLCRGSRGPGSRHTRGDLKQLATGNHTHETPWPSGFRWCGTGRSARGRTESRQTSRRAVSRSPRARCGTPSR